MIRKSMVFVLLLVAGYLAGCASVPMASSEEDNARKQFNPPTAGMSGLYLFRDSILGTALTKTIFVDDKAIGATATKTYFYKEVAPGDHKLSTQSEFGNNDLNIKTEADKLYFVRQYIKMGAFVGGANLEQVSDEAGKQGVRECNLAK